MGIFSPTAAKRVASNPDEFSTDDLHAAMDMIVNSEKFSEGQVNKYNNAIEDVIRARKEAGGRVFPKGTPVSAITYFDRSTKVFFECSLHPESKWASKQPGVSQWFAWSDNGHDCGCPMNGDTWVLSAWYNDGHA